MMRSLVSCFFILCLFLLPSCKDEPQIAGTKDTPSIAKTALWAARDEAPSCTLTKNHFFFTGAQNIGVRIFSGLHTAKKTDHTNEFIDNISPIYNSNGFVATDLARDLIATHFSQSCLNVEFLEGKAWFKPEHKEKLSEKIFLDLNFNFVEGALIDNLKEADALFITGRLRRFLPQHFDTPAPDLNKEEPDNVLNYDIHLYPRQIIITQDMDEEALRAAVKHEILLQLDFYIARTIFNQPIWEKNHLLTAAAYARYAHPENVNMPAPNVDLEAEGSGD